MAVNTMFRYSLTEVLHMDVIEKIKNELNNMTATQQRIGLAAIQNPMQVAFSSAKSLADKLHVSPASIVRFSQQITGGGGYPKLQQEIQAYIKATTDPVKKLEQNVIVSTQYEHLLAQIYETQLDNIKKTFNQELLKSINSATMLIAKAEHIYICGSRTAYATAYYLGHMLNRVFNNTDILSDDSWLADNTMRISKHDVLILVCFPRYSMRLLSVVKNLQATEAKIITIDCSPTSPFIPYSDIILTTFNHSNDFHNSQVSAMLVSEMIASQVISNSLDRALGNLSRIESTFSDLNQFCAPEQTPME